MKKLLHWILIGGVIGPFLISCGTPQTGVETQLPAAPTIEVTSTVTLTAEIEATDTPLAEATITLTPLDESKIYAGDTIELGAGTARTWIRLDDDGNPAAIGISFTEGMLSGLPPSMQMIQLQLPPEASTTPFDHVTLDWNPRGHNPRPYNVAHFDFHFYMISTEEQLAIRSGYDTVRPAGEYIPAFYAPGESPSVLVPDMGAHWRDTKSPELNGGLFTHTFFFGFHDGQMIFFEPMITKEYLETKPNVTAEIKQPRVFEKGGFYPTWYTIVYDAVKGEYSVILEGFVQR